jgi:hypothetical protein
MAYLQYLYLYIFIKIDQDKLQNQMKFFNDFLMLFFIFNYIQFD